MPNQGLCPKDDRTQYLDSTERLKVGDLMKKTLSLIALAFLLPVSASEAQDPKPAPAGDQPKPPVVRPDLSLIHI